jgi:dTDP-4-amino-4,6-dideoxygalactose transaminase
MKVDFYSTTSMPDSLKQDFARIFQNTLSQDNLIDGKACRNFEESFSDFLSVPFVLGVGNGFDALKIGLQAIGVVSGDRVAVPAHTFIATWYAVMAIGAIPVGVDVTLDGQINLVELEKISDLKAVIPVHMHGTHCDMSRLCKWAAENKILVLEDCAQAAGLDIQGKRAGSWGDAAAFSFYPTKNLFALGDGGAIAFKDQANFELARSLSRYGTAIGDKYSHIRLGQNSRLDTIQAAILTQCLSHLDEWNQVRKDVAAEYDLSFKQLGIIPRLTYESVYHHYIVLLDDRNKVKSALSEVSIGTEIHYPLVAGTEASPKQNHGFPISSLIAKKTLSLPISPWQTKIQTKSVIDSIQKTVKISDHTKFSGND